MAMLRLQAVASLSIAFLGTLLQLQLTETQGDASRDVTAVEHLAGAVGKVIRVCVGGP